MKSLADRVESLVDRVLHGENSYESTGRLGDSSIIGAYTGLVGGAVFGLVAGEQLNGYSDFLRNAPWAVQYGVDAVTTFVGAGIGVYAGMVGGFAVGGLVNLVKSFKK